jgi:hypothetical protein
MDDESNKNKYLKLNTLQDVQDLICDILTECRDTGDMVQHSGKICNLLQVWIKCQQLTELETINKRLDKLERRE